MGDVKTPVLTDKTGARIAEAMEINNALMREQLGCLTLQADLIGDISNRMNRMSGKEVFFVTATYADGSYTLKADTAETVAAYEAGKTLVLMLRAENIVYFYALLGATKNASGGFLAFNFGTSGQNPTGNIGMFVLNVAAGKLIFNATSSLQIGTLDSGLAVGGDFYVIKSTMQFASELLGAPNAAFAIAEL